MTDRWSVDFVGRAQELEIIQKHLLDFGHRRIIFIWGKGGIGKTRLLNEVERRFSAVETVIVPPIIDFDDDRYKISANIRFTLAQQIAPDAFEPYFEAFRDLCLSEGINPDRKTLAVERLFVECFNQVSQSKRIVIRVDTTDSLQDTYIKDLLDLSLNLNNILLLVAGRNAGDIYQQGRKEFGADAIVMELQPFISPESREYLDLKQHKLKVVLDPEWMNKLFILAGGVPVVIDLAIEWAKNHRLLPWMENLSLTELDRMVQGAQNDTLIRDQLNDLQEQFKKEIVMPVAQMGTLFDQLVFALAKVHPLDQEGIMEVLDIGQLDAKELLDQAIQSVVIKVLPDGIKLHDEIERLVTLYVWKVIDTDKTWEQSLKRKSIYYLVQRSNAILKEIRQIRQRENQSLDAAANPVIVLRDYVERHEKEIKFWTLYAEQLRLQLEIDIQDGYKLFQKGLALISTEKADRYVRSTLLNVIEPYANWSSPVSDIHGGYLRQEQQLDILRDLASELVRLGSYRRAASIYQILLVKTPPNTEEYAKVLNGQANWLVRAGQLQNALRCNEQVVQLSEQEGWIDLLITAKTEVGWINRLKGNLILAQKHYAEALQLAMKNNKEDSIAHIYSQMAYVHALQHHGSAIDEIKRAIAMRKRQGNQIRLGICYNIAGEVYLEAGQPKEAKTFFESSWSIFNQDSVDLVNEDTAQVLEWPSKSRSGRGYSYWQLASEEINHDPKTAHLNLLIALNDLKWAAEHATQFDSPAILNRLGEVYFLLEDYSNTANVWRRSMAEAKQVGDAFTEFHSLSDLARLAFHYPIAQFPDWHEFVRYAKREYRRRYQTERFEILDGLFYTYLGHLALKDEQIQDAVSLYERGLLILSEAGTYTSFNLAGQLEFIQKKIIPHIPAAAVRELGIRLQEIWGKGKIDVIALGYFYEWARWDKNAQLA